MNRRSWWQKPHFHTEEEQGQSRSVSWLELFYDLVFVIAISRAVQVTIFHTGSEGLSQFTFLFIPIWWTWIATTYYNERFETTGLENRLIVFLQMLVVSGLALYANNVFTTSYTGFALSYAAGRIIITALWIRAGTYETRFRSTAKWYTAGFTTAIILVFVSTALDSPLRYLFFGGALILDLLTPVFTINIQRSHPRFSSSKLPERFGLFTIIVLGETIVGVLKGLTGQYPIDLSTVLLGILSLAIGFCLWWIYFDFIARRPFKPKRTSAFFWSYLHMPLVMAIAASGGYIANILSNSNFDVTSGSKLFLSFAISVAVTIMGLIELTLGRKEDEPTHPVLSPAIKILIGITIAVCGLLFYGIHLIFYLSGMIVLLMIPISYGVYVWYFREITEPYNIQE